MCAAARATAILVLAFAALASAARAQSGALSGVRGTVRDSAGEPVPHAAVTLRQEATGRVITVAADANGRFLILNQAPGGPYALAAERLGYASAAPLRFRLLAGTVHAADIALGTAAVALPAIEVRAAADARFGAERSGAATVVDRGAVLAHPTIERNVMELVALSPMSARTEQGFTIAGQNSRYNAFQIDGARFQDQFGLAADGVPGGTANATPLPLHAIEQFQVLIAPFDVRQSGFTGGLLNVVTRSGTNRWEGTAFGHYRDRNFLGALDLPGGAGARPDRFHNAVTGAAFGGPLRRDRAHIFAALELERRTAPSGGYNLGRADPVAVGIAADSAAALHAILAERYGFDAGDIGQLSLDSERENAFARLDWQLANGQRLSARWNYTGARRDLEPNRAPTGAYEFGSQLVRHGAAAHAGTLQLISSLGRWSNELLFSVQSIRDRSTPASSRPIVEVAIRSDFPGITTLRTARAGGHFEAQANRLSQTSAELRDALTGALGPHLLTFGAGVELARFRSLYIANPAGRYRFDDLGSLRANRPTHFERTLGGERASFAVSHLSAFVQDEFQATSRLTLRAGLRVDAPIVRERPRGNEALLASELAVNTATIPDARALLSPRAAFNWQSGARLQTQLRGGVGVFAGRPSYAWLASAYVHTGLDMWTLTCTGSDRTPRLDGAAPPTGCADAPRPSDLQAPPIVAFSRDFREPQDLRMALGIDQALPGGLVATGDLVLTRALRQIHLRDLNLVTEPVTEATHALGYSDGYGFHLRDAYGVPVLDGFAPRRRTDAYGPVIELGESASNRALAASFELSGTARGVRFSSAYTYTRSIDAQSLVYRDAATNLGRTANGTDPDPEARVSDFDRPHRLVAAVAAVPFARGPELSVLFTAESGAPYTYVYAGDINGDGFPGPGTQDAHNDPVYVSADVSEFPGSLASAAAYARLIDADPCLRQWRGGVLSRNHCRAPASYRLDLRAAQVVRARGIEVRVIADVLNLLQMFGSDRGLLYRVSPLAPILQPIGRTPQFGDPNPERAELESWYSGGLVRNPETGAVQPLLPYAPDLAASRWQAQIGLEIRPVFRPD